MTQHACKKSSNYCRCHHRRAIPKYLTFPLSDTLLYYYEDHFAIHIISQLQTPSAKHLKIIHNNWTSVSLFSNTQSTVVYLGEHFMVKNGRLSLEVMLKKIDFAYDCHFKMTLATTIKPFMLVVPQ